MRPDNDVAVWKTASGCGTAAHALKVLKIFVDRVRRRRALEVIVARGTECVPLLDAIAPMLMAKHPVERRRESIDARSSRVKSRPRTSAVTSAA